MKTPADIIITDLLNALDAIVRSDSLPFAQGCAEQAMKAAQSRMVRNSDGYLVVPPYAVRKQLREATLRIGRKVSR